MLPTRLVADEFGLAEYTSGNTKEVIAFLFILCQRRLACQKVIEFRGERANVRQLKASFMREWREHVAKHGC